MEYQFKILEPISYNININIQHKHTVKENQHIVFKPILYLPPHFLLNKYLYYKLWI